MVRQLDLASYPTPPDITTDASLFSAMRALELNELYRGRQRKINNIYTRQIEEFKAQAKTNPSLLSLINESDQRLIMSNMPPPMLPSRRDENKRKKMEVLWRLKERANIEQNTDIMREIGWIANEGDVENEVSRQHREQERRVAQVIRRENAGLLKVFGTNILTALSLTHKDPYLAGSVALSIATLPISSAVVGGAKGITSLPKALKYIGAVGTTESAINVGATVGYMREANKARKEAGLEEYSGKDLAFASSIATLASFALTGAYAGIVARKNIKAKLALDLAFDNKFAQSLNELLKAKSKKTASMFHKKQSQEALEDLEPQGIVAEPEPKIEPTPPKEIEQKRKGAVKDVERLRDKTFEERLNSPEGVSFAEIMAEGQGKNVMFGGESLESIAKRSSKAKPKAEAEPEPMPYALDDAMTKELGRDVYKGQVELGDISLDPKKFQFRSQAEGTTGLAGRLENVSLWRPSAAGRLILYQDKQGKLWLADGHHRYNKALELGVEDELEAVILRANDGWTPEQVKKHASITNIRQGAVSPLDIRNAIKDATDKEIKDIKDTIGAKTLFETGQGLAKLNDVNLYAVVNGVVEDWQGGLIGNTLSPDKHEQAISFIASVKPETREKTLNILQQIKVLKDGTLDQATADMFGNQPLQSFIIHRANILEKAIKDLKLDKSTARLLAKRDDKIRQLELGDIDKERAIKIRDDVEYAIAILRKRANLAGDEIAESLNKIVNGLPDNPKAPQIIQATKDFIARVKEIIKKDDVEKPAPQTTQQRAFDITEQNESLDLLQGCINKKGT